MENEVTTTTKDVTTNPAPLGLLGFGMTTVLLNVHNAGFIELGTMVLAMGICYGGIAQVIAGIMEWKKGNTFGTTAFISYGFFWLSLVALLVMPKIGWWPQAPDSTAMAVYLFMWGLFTGVMFIISMKLGKALRVVFGTLTILFFLLTMSETSGSILIKQIAGFEGILCGASAIYTGLALVMNEVYGKTIAPV